MALKNLFLKGYSGVDEDDYSVAVYTQHAVYDSLFYLLDRVILTSGVMLFLGFCIFLLKKENGVVEFLYDFHFSSSTDIFSQLYLSLLSQSLLRSV